jgi:hypothetical protein
MAVLQLSVEPVTVDDLLGLVAQNYGLEQRPQRTTERQADELTWSLYAFQVQGVPRDLALAQSEGVTLLVLMRSAAGERDALYEAVFLPAVDALVPLR